MAQLDDSMMDDFLDAMENLVALENHFLESGIKKMRQEKEGLLDKIAPKAKENPPDFDMADEIRNMRQKLQQALIFGQANLSEEERTRAGESACSLKHINFARMTLKETAQKLWRENRKSEALYMFKQIDLLRGLRREVLRSFKKW